MIVQIYVDDIVFGGMSKVMVGVRNLSPNSMPNNLPNLLNYSILVNYLSWAHYPPDVGGLSSNWVTNSCVQILFCFLLVFIGFYCETRNFDLVALGHKEKKLGNIKENLNTSLWS